MDAFQEMQLCLPASRTPSTTALPLSHLARAGEPALEPERCRDVGELPSTAVHAGSGPALYTPHCISFLQHGNHLTVSPYDNACNPQRQSPASASNTQQRYCRASTVSVTSLFPEHRTPPWMDPPTQTLSNQAAALRPAKPPLQTLIRAASLSWCCS